jgi:hypothetical protein
MALSSWPARNGLVRRLHRSTLHCTDGHWDITMGRYEDNGELDSELVGSRCRSKPLSRVAGSSTRMPELTVDLARETELPTGSSEL